MHANSNRTASAVAQAILPAAVATRPSASPSRPPGGGAPVLGASPAWPCAATAGPRAPRAIPLGWLAEDLRRLASHLELLDHCDELARRLAAPIGALVEAIGRQTPALAVAPIAAAVGAAFGVTCDELVARRRDQHVALARQVAIYLIRELTGVSFARIGGYFGRDHSTAIHSHARIARRVADEAHFRILIGELKASLTRPARAPLAPRLSHATTDAIADPRAGVLAPNL